jgi:hypothetical protein
LNGRWAFVALDGERLEDRRVETEVAKTCQG